MSKRMKYEVSGKVQGVFYRDFAEDSAAKYSLTGYVKNHNDGSVHIEAQGSEDALAKFKKDLGVGPRAAKVDRIDERELEVKVGEKTFER